MAELLYEGKAKQVYKTDKEDEYLIHYKDDATAGNGVKHDDDPQAGKQVGQVDPPVAAQVGAGQLPVEAQSPVIHGRPRSFPGGWQAGSKCGKWPGTSRRRSWRPGRSDGTLGRP